MALEAETKGKVEALRMKKKLDSDVVDLGVALEHANAANAESQRNISLIQGNIRNVQKRFEEESRAKAAATDSLISADRRANANQNALEEARTLLEQADRNRRNVEQELGLNSYKVRRRSQSRSSWTTSGTLLVSAVGMNLRFPALLLSGTLSAPPM